MHIDNLRGHNTHHQIETVFKAFGRAPGRSRPRRTGGGARTAGR
ncbi:hypothetical protein CP915_33170 [Pseudomonas aeruginosa]|nr:hypothetical protein CP915_33170 [Pseudomonas aeruginosa]